MVTSNSEMITRHAIKSARARARSNSEANMISVVRITRGVEATLDSDGLLVPDPAPSVIYEGKARLGTAEGPVTYTIGEEVQFFSSGSCSIPLQWTYQPPTPPATIDNPDPLPPELVTEPVWVQVNDSLEVTAHDDPIFVGRHFRIVDVRANGLVAGARRLQIVGVQRYPGWIDSAVRHPSFQGTPDEVPPEWYT